MLALTFLGVQLPPTGGFPKNKREQLYSQPTTSTWLAPEGGQTDTHDSSWKRRSRPNKGKRAARGGFPDKIDAGIHFLLGAFQELCTNTRCTPTVTKDQYPEGSPRRCAFPPDVDTSALARNEARSAREARPD
ncbi:unnamed protein product [Lampetra planeri]